MVHWAKVHDPWAMMEGDQCLEQKVWITVGCPLVEMHATDWAKAQRENPMLSAVLEWLKAQKQTSLRMCLVEHASSEESNWSYGIDRISWFVPMLNAQRQNWRSPALHGCQGTWCCHFEWVPQRYRSSRAWPYTILVVGMLLVARNDQPGAEIHKVLHALLVAWRQFVQSVLTPNCVHCFNGSLACRLY